MKKFSNKLIYILLGLIVFLAEFYIIQYYYDMYQSKKQSRLLDNISNEENILFSENSNEQDKADTQNDKQTNIKTERMSKLEELQKENKDIVAWIEIEGTNINYPVLQGKDNDFYMNHNYKKGYSQSGSIFLDKDSSISPASSNLLLYGHHMKNGSMFTDLLKYANKEYYEEHPAVRFTTNIDDSEYEIISAFKSKVYYASEKNVFRYYYFINADSEEEYNEFVNNAKKSSLYDTGKSAKYRRYSFNTFYLCISYKRRKICCRCKKNIVFLLYFIY